MACKLCKKNKPLRRSHIFPEWLYQPLYDDNHRFYVLSTDSNKRRGTRPKGIYEKLLCDECEQKFSKWEQVVKKYELWKNIVFRHGPDKLREFPGFHDEKLKGEFKGQRSSRLNIQYRVIYSIEKEVVSVYVIDITPHKY